MKMTRLLRFALVFCLWTVALTLYSSASAFKLPDTGQTKCYRDISPYDEITCPAPGNPLAQDGSYNINPKSYTDNGNGTITDNNTGLMWQKCSAGQNNDSSCSGAAEYYNWYQSFGEVNAAYNPSDSDYKNVCGSLSTGGYSDWRLPSKKELITIVDYSIPYPYPTIKTQYFPNTVASGYWSSTTDAYSPDYRWAVYFFDGHAINGSYDIYYSVRCVRVGH